MKFTRLFALVLVSLLAFSCAVAEGGTPSTFTPSMFLGSRGLMVLDENQMTSPSESEEGSTSMGMPEGVTWCGFVQTEGENTVPAIVFNDGEKSYAAFDMTAMFGGGGTMGGAGVASVFFDLIKTYEFDYYIFQYKGMDGPIICGDIDALIKMTGGDETSTITDVIKSTYTNFDEFLAAATAAINE